MARKFNESKLDFTEFMIVNVAKSFSDKIKVSRSWNA
jgi:hypothetical protein